MTSNEVDYGVPVVMTSVMHTLTLKQEQEINMLHNLLNDPRELRNFGAFNRVVQDLQATIRAIDILDNSVLAHGFDTGRDVHGTQDEIPSFLRTPAPDENEDDNSQETEETLDEKSRLGRA